MDEMGQWVVVFYFLRDSLMDGWMDGWMRVMVRGWALDNRLLCACACVSVCES